MDKRFDEMVDLIRERILLKNLVEVNPKYSFVLMPRINEIKTLINSTYADVVPSPKDAFALITLQLSSKITDTAIDHLRDINNIKEDEVTG